jgi:hypothetical protein
MDFRQTIQQNPRSAANSSQPTHGGSDDSSRASASSQQAQYSSGGGKWLKVLTVVVVVGIAIILAAIALGLGHGKSNDNEAKFVDKSKYQAVFLNNGQVYFGNVTTLNDQYVRMTNIYYLTQADSSGTSASNSSYSLVKLGCQQIHDPYDAMVINRDQVSFWENLQDNGKVVSSINKFKQQNPNGPDCSQVSNQTQASNSNAQGASGSTNTTPKQ